MAVWIHIIGLRKLDSLEEEKERISEILNKAEFDFDFVKKKSDIQFKGVDFFELPILGQSLKIYFNNPNFIEFSGSFELFSLWSRFADKEQSKLTNEIRKVFRKIAFEYGISELIYFSEWFFELSDTTENKIDLFKDLIKQIKNYPDLKRNELFGLKSNEYYIEKTSPVANNV